MIIDDEDYAEGWAWAGLMLKSHSPTYVRRHIRGVAGADAFCAGAMDRLKHAKAVQSSG